MANYTAEELKTVGRVELRRRAVALGMNNKDCTNSTSEQLKQFILEAQEGAGEEGEEGEEPKKSKARARAEGEGEVKTSKGNGKTRQTRTTKAKEEVEETAASSGASNEKIDHLGAAMDEEFEKVNNRLNEICEAHDSADRQRFIMMGLLSDIYKNFFEPDELEERIKELEADCDNSGN